MTKLKIKEARQFLANGCAMVETYTPNDCRNRWGNFAIEVDGKLKRLNTMSAVTMVENNEVKMAFKVPCRYNPSHVEIHYKAAQ